MAIQLKRKVSTEPLSAEPLSAALDTHRPTTPMDHAPIDAPATTSAVAQDQQTAQDDQRAGRYISPPGEFITYAARMLEQAARALRRLRTGPRITPVSEATTNIHAAQARIASLPQTAEDWHDR